MSFDALELIPLFWVLRKTCPGAPRGVEPIAGLTNSRTFAPQISKTDAGVEDDTYGFNR